MVFRVACLHVTAWIFPSWANGMIKFQLWTRSCGEHVCLMLLFANLRLQSLEEIVGNAQWVNDARTIGQLVQGIRHDSGGTLIQKVLYVGCQLRNVLKQMCLSTV